MKTTTMLKTVAVAAKFTSVTLLVCVTLATFGLDGGLSWVIGSFCGLGSGLSELTGD